MCCQCSLESHKHQQDIPIFAQTLGRLGILCFIAQQEMVQRLGRRRPSLGNGDLIELGLGLSLQPFRYVVKHVGGLVFPAALRAGRPKHLRQRSPEAQRPIPSGQFRIDFQAAKGMVPRRESNPHVLSDNGF